MSQRFSSTLNLGVVQHEVSKIALDSPEETQYTESKQRQRSWIDLHFCQDLAIS